MRLLDISAALGALSVFSLGANASPIESELVERQSSFFALTGATGGVYPRLEVRDLANNPDQWNLFVLAMQRFQLKPQTNKLSYYQVAGIHGRPYVNWDGVGPYASQPWWPGYCPHSSNLFGSWHRPYLSLWEQAIIQYANEIINETPAGATKTRYQTAVKTLRFPFWDWAKKTSSGITPQPLTQAYIQVTFPQNGSSKSIPNPLYAYRFQVVPDPYFDGSYSKNRQTTRSSRAEANLQASYTSRRNTLLTLFSRNQAYNVFSTDANGNTAPNLEGIHNGVHSDIGGYMAQISYSAMDPIFAMHHANVDRVVAIWQTLYPNSWVGAASQTAGTRTMAPSSNQNANSPLTPFHRDTKGTFWTSNSVRATSALGYTYPDLVGVSNSQLTTNLNRLYGNSATNSALRGGSSDGDAPATTYDYMAQVTLDKSVLGGVSYAVQFMLDGDYFASFAALAVPPSPGAQAKAVTSSGTVMLTDALAQRGIDTSDRNATEQYLSENLTWQVVQNDQVVNNVPNLNVTIASAEVQPAKAVNQFATWLEPPQEIDNSTSSS
ncbi:di-copper centre-containing protein [Diplodia corticola]|uniref:tyrosinase n=1 Tax=Diplodia corticola TaxID=236234 RepID=A0A1J9R1M8_9PEZI|nr:di-copper centre-containing protein [Diplodia corticola]OJD35302.1 di-copper centre-containing protein [Diplodia corticola]